MVLRMLFLDHFFLFMGMNSQKTEDESALVDNTQYLFLLKGNSVKSEFKLHKSIVYLDKNVDNRMKNKYLLSLGYDEQVDSTGNAVQNALVFKIWDFISLDNYMPATSTQLTGGSVWDKHENDQRNMMTPIMYKIEIDGKPYLDPIKKFAVSHDCVLAALVTN